MNPAAPVTIQSTGGAILASRFDASPVRSPSFTVLIPAFDAAATLSAALDSVLAQTWPAADVLVVDDGSRNHTGAVAEAYGGIVRVVRKENGGTASARNRGI